MDIYGETVGGMTAMELMECYTSPNSKRLKLLPLRYPIVHSSRSVPLGDKNKTKKQLIDELLALRAKITKMNASQSDPKLSLAFNASPISSSIIRLKDACCVEVNDAFTRTWGYDRHEAIGKSVEDLGIWRHTEQWEYVTRLLADCGIIRDLEIHLWTKAGDERTTLLSAEPLEVQCEPCMLLVTVDVTDRSRAMERLRRANAYNHGLMEARLDPLVVMGPDGSISDANMAAEQITGCSRERLIDTDFANYFLEPEKARSAHRQALHEGTVRDYPLELRSRDGHTGSVLYNASVCWDEDGQLIGVVASTHDITHRKQAEARLKESEERYRIAIERSNDGVAIARGGRHLYVNQKFLEMFGYDSPKDIVGATTYSGVHSDDLKTVMEYARKRECGEPAPSQYTFKGVRKDGAIIFVEVSVASIVFHGEPASLAYLRDITERKKVEEERLYSAKLESALEMAGAVCHELNQPLQVISNYSDILLEENANDIHISKKLEAIREQTHRMGRITKKLVGVKQYSIRDYIGTIKIIDIDEESGGNGA